MGRGCVMAWPEEKLKLFIPNPGNPTLVADKKKATALKASGLLEKHLVGRLAEAWIDRRVTPTHGGLGTDD